MHIYTSFCHPVIFPKKMCFCIKCYVKASLSKQPTQKCVHSTFICISYLCPVTTDFDRSPREVITNCTSYEMPQIFWTDFNSYFMTSCPRNNELCKHFNNKLVPVGKVIKMIYGHDKFKDMTIELKCWACELLLWWD